MTTNLRRCLTTVCCALMLSACTTPAPLIYNTLTCSSNTPHEIVVKFQANGCLEQNDPVEPEYIDACPGDTVIWQASRSGLYSTDPFAIFFSPLDRTTPPLMASRITDTIWDSAPKGLYKYSVVARSLRQCPDNSVDPRIKVDPR